MKIELTREWKKTVDKKSSTAFWKDISLYCQYNHLSGRGWIGRAEFFRIHRYGGVRKSMEMAQQDAEDAAVELLLDIRDGTRMLMSQYGIGEDD